MLGLLERYDQPFVDALRNAMSEDFANYDGGYPRYLDHISRVVAKIERGNGVSAEQVQSYKTLSNFIEKGMKPNLGTLRLLHAYILIENPKAARVCVSRLSPEIRAENLAQTKYKFFKGRDSGMFPSYGLDTFRLVAPDADGQIFGESWLDAYYEETKWIDGDQRLKIRDNRQRELWLVLERQKGRKYDFAHFILLNRKSAESALDTFLNRAREIGFKAARASLSTDWLFQRASGFVFWDGLRFEGRVVSTSDRSPIDLNGFNFITYCGTHSIDRDISLTELTDELELDPYRLKHDHPVALLDAINLEYRNLRTGKQHAAADFSGKGKSFYWPVVDRDQSLYSDLEETQDRISEAAETGYTGKALTSLDIFAKYGPPFRTSHPFVKCAYGRTERKMPILLKLFLRTGTIAIEEPSELYEARME